MKSFVPRLSKRFYPPWSKTLEFLDVRSGKRYSDVFKRQNNTGSITTRARAVNDRNRLIRGFVARVRDENHSRTGLEMLNKKVDILYAEIIIPRKKRK